MKLIRDDWSIMLIHKISREWEWALIPMGIGRKKIEGSRAFLTRKEARADALQLAANCGLKIYIPNKLSNKTMLSEKERDGIVFRLAQSLGTTAERLWPLLIKEALFGDTVSEFDRANIRKSSAPPEACKQPAENAGDVCACANNMVLSGILHEMLDAIDVTGGLCYHEEGLNADPDWYDMAVLYRQACEVLGRPCVRTPADDETEEEEAP